MMMFLYFSYKLVQVFVTCDRADVSLFKKLVSKVWKNNCLSFFIYNL